MGLCYGLSPLHTLDSKVSCRPNQRGLVDYPELWTEHRGGGVRPRLLSLSPVEAAGGNVTAVDSGRYEHRHFAATLLAVEQDGAACLPEHPLKSMAVQQILHFSFALRPGDTQHWAWTEHLLNSREIFLHCKIITVVREVEGCTWWLKEECSESDSADDAANDSNDDGDGCPASTSLNATGMM